MIESPQSNSAELPISFYSSVKPFWNSIPIYCPITIKGVNPNAMSDIYQQYTKPKTSPPNKAKKASE